MSVKSLCRSYQTRDALKGCFDVRRRPSRVRIVSFQVRDVSFDGGSAVDSLRKKVARLLSAGSRVVILIGENPEKFSEPQKEFFKHLVELQARVFYNKRVHAKVTLVESKGEKIAVLGSANLTDKGLYRNIEVNVAISGSSPTVLNAYDEISDYIEQVLGQPSTHPIDEWLE
jgi:phosphatidylserine/phosphatidylglycerophosphate/cardiolipin synthase-like enzyme